MHCSEKDVTCIFLCFVCSGDNYCLKKKKKCKKETCNSNFVTTSLISIGG